ncbi:uncharacterized protein LOC131915684 [Peromyscus eremicus]|uniref:uncharacterized protein LOC131915684 n=1 Tax=Peromyscus eremicus TaxID=42410 RepID=UPI0027DC71C7|nr:uncharacterized protein LOC131915684 [Peromyscus eremicus]
MKGERARITWLVSTQGRITSFGGDSRGSIDYRQQRAYANVVFYIRVISFPSQPAAPGPGWLLPASAAAPAPAAADTVQAGAAEREVLRPSPVRCGPDPWHGRTPIVDHESVMPTEDFWEPCQTNPPQGAIQTWTRTWSWRMRKRRRRRRRWQWRSMTGMTRKTCWMTHPWKACVALSMPSWGKMGSGRRGALQLPHLSLSLQSSLGTKARS